MRRRPFSPPSLSLLLVLVTSPGCSSAPAVPVSVDPGTVDPSQADQEEAPAEAPAEPWVVRVRQDASGDLQGVDDVALREALGALAETGGVLEVGPGTWPLRNTLRVPSGVTLRGEEGTVLLLPPPTRLARAAARGSRELDVEDPAWLIPGSILEALPPEEDWSGWDASVPIQERFVRVASVEGNVVALSDPLPRDMKAGSRLGFGQKMVWIDTATDVVIENLVFDGGRRPGIEMPGHQKRSAVWSGSLFSHEEGPLQPPSRGVTVRHCLFRDLYGRGVAFYNTTDSEVVGCRFRDIADEAIDFDHFTYRCRAVGNDVERAVFGVTINDGSDHLVEHNRIADCGTGLTIWWLDSIDPEGLNRGNVLRHNVVRGATEAAIALGKGCRDNVVRNNWVQGAIEVVEPENEVADNWRLGSPRGRFEEGGDRDPRF